VLGSAMIGDNVRVRRSIVMGRIESGAHVIDSVIGLHGVVGSGLEISDAFVPDPSSV
jgi:NDP-sugar pyrophosphorylase family protein